MQVLDVTQALVEQPDLVRRPKSASYPTITPAQAAGQARARPGGRIAGSEVGCRRSSARDSRAHPSRSHRNSRHEVIAIAAIRMVEVKDRVSESERAWLARSVVVEQEKA